MKNILWNIPAYTSQAHLSFKTFFIFLGEEIYLSICIYVSHYVVLVSPAAEAAHCLISSAQSLSFLVKLWVECLERWREPGSTRTTQSCHYNGVTTLANQFSQDIQSNPVISDFIFLVRPDAFGHLTQLTILFLSVCEERRGELSTVHPYHSSKQLTENPFLKSAGPRQKWQGIWSWTSGVWSLVLPFSGCVFWGQFAFLSFLFLVGRNASVAICV